MKTQKISFLSSESKKKDIVKLNHLKKIYGDFSIDECDVIVALGGDGHMLSALHIAKSVNKPVYGMNQGTIGFLMNTFLKPIFSNAIFHAKIPSVTACLYS